MIRCLPATGIGTDENGEGVLGCVAAKYIDDHQLVQLVKESSTKQRANKAKREIITRFNL